MLDEGVSVDAAAGEQGTDGEAGDGGSSAGAVGGTDAGDASEPGTSSGSDQPGGSDQPDQPPVPDQPSGPADSGNEPAVPADPAQPSGPSDADKPGDAADPVGPADPVSPSDPANADGKPSDSADAGKTPDEPVQNEAVSGTCGVRFYVVTPDGKASYASLAEALGAAGVGRSAEDAPLAVALDAAHDGEHAGGTAAGLAESDATLALAWELNRLAQDDPALKTLLVRSGSDALAPGSSEADELAARVKLAEDAGADVLVELHVNLGAGELACAVPAAQDGLPVIVVELTLPGLASSADYAWLAGAAGQMLADAFDPASDEPVADGDASASSVASARSALAELLSGMVRDLPSYAQAAPVKQDADAAAFAGAEKKPTATFPDVPADSWYAKGGYIDYVVANGLMGGYTDGADAGKFGPEDCITREQVVTILYRCSGASADGGASHFSDVATGQYYSAAVEWAYENGIVSGYFGTGRFGVGEPITREDFATMLYRYAQRCGASGSTGDISGFPDAGSINSWARTALAWCNAQKIVTGDETWTPARLNPQGNTTRGQAAKMFTVLMRDVLDGATPKASSWSLEGVSVSNSYVLGSGSVVAKASVKGSGSGLTYKYMWTGPNDTAWYGTASSSASAALSFSATGTYTVYLQVSDAIGTTFIRTCTVQVWDMASGEVTSDGGATWTMKASLNASSTKGFTYKFTWKRGYDESQATTVGSQTSGSPSLSVTLSAQDYYWFYVKAIDPEGHEAYRAKRVLYAPSGKFGWQNPSYMYQVSSYNVAPHSYSRGILSYMTPSRIGAAATRSDCVEAFIARAYEYLGTSYVWNYACAPGVGVDCVGLVMQCAYAVGMDTKAGGASDPACLDPICHWDTGSSGLHSQDANNMWNHGKIQRLDISQRSRGDLIFWYGHVAIYLGNNQIIQALPSGGVYISSIGWSGGTYNYSNARGVGRLFAM